MAPFRFANPRYVTYFAVEGGLILGVLYGLANLTLLLTPEVVSSNPPLTVASTGALFAGMLLLTQHQRNDQANLLRELLIFGVLCWTAGLLVFASVWIASDEPLRLSAFLALEGAVAIPLAVAGWRWLSVRYSVLNLTRERVLIVGTSEVALQLCRWISTDHGSDYAVVGFAGEHEEQIGQVLAMGTRVQTDYESLVRFASQRADRVVVALEEKRGKLPVRELMELRLLGVEIEEATSLIERISGRISVETMLPSWLIFSEGFKTSRLRSAVKRAADLLFSGVLLLVTAPLMALAAVAIKLDTRGPVLYRQARLGVGGREFNMLKFRSMALDAEAAGPTWARPNDPRVTRVGRILRNLRIDELPQLINVLRGEMSFVGPRPERGHFVRQLETKIPYYGLRFTVRPGVTGWAQVEYRYASTEEDSLEKLKYDLYYIKNSSLLLDLWIVAKTVKVVLSGTGAH